MHVAVQTFVVIHVNVFATLTIL